MLKTKRKSNQTTAQPQTNQAETKASQLKERLAKRRKAERIRKDLIRFTTFAIFFSALIGFVLGLVSDPKVGVGATVGVLYTALSFKYPRYALWAFLIYMPFSGTITYALGNSPLLQLAKDGFYIPALIGVVQYCRRERLPIFISKPLMAPLFALLALCLMTLVFVNGYQQIYNEAGEKPIMMGILGLKVLIGYVPLIVCAYYLVRDKKDLFFLMRLTVVLILVCCGLAFIQYLMLRTGRCAGTGNATGAALFRASLQARCFVGGALLYSPQHGQIRLPGTFVAPWQWGWFLISSGFLAFTCAFNDPLARWRTMGLLSMASVFVMSVLSGQRIALALVPTTVVLLLVLTGQIVNLKRFLPIAVGMAMMLGIAAINNPAIVQERYDSFVGRWNASPPQDFIMSQLQWAMREQDGWFGKGLGRATNAARDLGETTLVETYYPKLIFEIGPLGVVAFLVFVTVLTYVTFRAYRSVRNRDLRSYGASFWVFVLFISYNTYYYPLDVDPVAVYYWFFAGVILKLPELDRQEKLAALAEEEALPRSRRRLKRRSGFV